MRRLLSLLFALGMGSAPSFAPPVDPALAAFLATGFRAHEYSNVETPIFVNTFGSGVVQVHNERTTLFFAEFLGALRSSLQDAMVRATAISVEQAACFGRPGRGSKRFDLADLPEPYSKRLRRTFTRAVLAAADEEKSFRWVSGKGWRHSWPRDWPLRANAIPLVRIDVFFHDENRCGEDDSANVELLYPALSSLHRRALDAHFGRLYRRALSSSLPAQEARNSAYEIAWWILSTVFFEKGSTSMAKGVIAALTGETFAVQESGDDIDLVAIRSAPHTFRDELVRRFDLVSCESCGCFLRRQ